MARGEDTGTVTAASTEGWRDRKRYLWLIGLVVPSLAFLGYGMHALTGWGVWFWIGPIVILVVVPAIDLVAGLDRSNPPDDVIEALEQDRYYRWITYLFLPIQYAGFVGAFWLIASGDLSVADRIGLAVSIGCIGGIGINGNASDDLKRAAYIFSIWATSKDTQFNVLSGVGGTPTFVLGRTTATSVEGPVMVGALPYAQFDAKLRSLLAPEPK